MPPSTTRPELEELRAFASPRLAAYKLPEAVDVVDEGQSEMKRRNGCPLQNSAALFAPVKSSRWRYILDIVIVQRTDG